MKNNVLLIYLAITGFCTIGTSSYGQEKGSDDKLYSDFYYHQGVIYTSGILGTDVEGDISNIFEDEVRQLFENLDQILHKAKITKDKVYSVTVYLKDIKRINEFNALYKNYFQAPFPVRTCVGVEGLAKSANVEISINANAGIEVR